MVAEDGFRANVTSGTDRDDADAAPGLTRCLLLKTTRPRQAGSCLGKARTDQAVTTLTVRRLLAPLTENATWPSTSANRV